MPVQDRAFVDEHGHREEIRFQIHEERQIFNLMVVPGCQVTDHSIGFYSGR